MAEWWKNDDPVMVTPAPGQPSGQWWQNDDPVIQPSKPQPTYQPAPGIKDLLAAREGDDPMTAQVRGELRMEREKATEDEKKRIEEFKAGDTSWWDILRPYPGKFKPQTKEQKEAEEKATAAQSLIAQGGSVGLSDELGAIVAVPGEMISRGLMNPLTAYDYAKTRRNIELDEARKKAGGVGVLAEIGGAVGSGAGALRAGATFAPRIANARALRNAPVWIRNLLGRSADAAAFGGAYGVGSGTSVEDRLQKGGQGAVLGALLAAPPPSVAVGAGLGAAGTAYYSGGDPVTTLTGLMAGGLIGPFAARGIGNRIRSVTNPGGVAGEAVASAITGGGRTLDDVELGMRRAARDQAGDMWTLADETAPQTRSTLSAVGQAPSTRRDQTYQQLLDRQGGQGERVVFELERLAGDPRTARQVYAARDAERRLTNDELFGQARAESGPVDVRPILNVIDEGIHAGVPPTRAQVIENRMAALLDDTLAAYPAPDRRSGRLYTVAYERNLIPEIEEGLANGLSDQQIVASLVDRIGDVAAPNRTQLVRRVRTLIGAPDANDPAFTQWRMDALDRSIAREQAEAVRGLPRNPNDAIADALRDARGTLADRGGSIDRFEHLWRARQNLETQIQRVGLNQGVIGQPPTNNPIGIHLTRVREAIDDALAQAAPSYRHALEEARRGRLALRAIERGQQMTRRGRARDNIADYNALTPEEQGGIRTGYTSDVAGMIEAGSSGNQLSKVSTPKRRAELNAIAPTRARANRFNRARERERQMWETFQYAFGGSPTARRLAEQDSIPELLNPEIIGSLLSGQPSAAARNLVARGNLWRQGYTPEVRDEILRMLMARPGAEMRGVSEQLRESVMGAEARRRTQANLLRLGHTGIAPSLTD